MAEHTAEKDEPACICFPVSRIASLDGRDGWFLTEDACRWHGRNHFGNRPVGTPPNRVIPPGADQ